MIGIAYVRTPFGKVNASDSRNYWTVVVETDNFAGPLAYFAPEWWSKRRDPGTEGFVSYSEVPLIRSGPVSWESQGMQEIVDNQITKIAKMSIPYHNGRTVLWM